MASRGGLTFASDGRLIITSNASPSTNFYSGGWGLNGANGAAYFNDLGATAVPATAKFLGGLAFTQSGSLYCTTDTTGPFTYLNGMKVRSDGALFILAASPGAGDVAVSGWFFKGGAGATAGAVLAQIV
jgi:hypothetical protein